MVSLCIVLVLSYLIGSVPTSIIVGRKVKGIDIRDFGSGNAGATNVYRVLGLKVALLVFAIDAGKAAATVLLLTQLQFDPLPISRTLFQMCTGLAVIGGNICPIFAGFSGGKGVSTSTGVFVALTPVATVCALVLWLAVVSTTKYISLGSIAASLILPTVVIVQRVVFHLPIPLELILLTLLMPIIILAAHRSNIKRLLSGTERQIGSNEQESGASQ